ncbi:MAG TPA: regulator [Methylocella sp.]|nr:regulator [Methylocella sp.]
MMTIKFDERNVRWFRLEGISDVWYHVLEVDQKNRIVDILFKFSAGAKIVLQRHRAAYRTFVIQGELRIYNANGDLKEIRGVGSYVSRPAGGEPHREGGGDQDVIAVFSNRDVEGPIYEILDDDLNTTAILGLEDFKALLEAQQT